jgi:hypothetical protein
VGNARRISPAHGQEVPLPEPDLCASHVHRALAGPRRVRWTPNLSIGHSSSGHWLGAGREHWGPTRRPPAAPRWSLKSTPREEAARPPRHARWVAIYEAVHALRVQGRAMATIARQLGISRPTVYANLRRDTPPGPRRCQWPPSARVLTPYIPYLIRRWCESQADSVQLWREIQALGYTHSARTVCRCITRVRRAADGGQPPESQRSPYTRPQWPSGRAVSGVIVGPGAKRSSDAQTYLDRRARWRQAWRRRVR